MDNLIYITCIFGKDLTYIIPAPSIKNSYFFTNNPELKPLIIENKWNYIYVDKPLVDNTIISSLQSKYIKFLVFLDDFPKFKLWKKNCLFG